MPCRESWSSFSPRVAVASEHRSACSASSARSIRIRKCSSPCSTGASSSCRTSPSPCSATCLKIFGVESSAEFGAFELPGASDFATDSEALPRQGWRSLEGLVDRIDVTDDIGQPDKHKAWSVRRLRNALRKPELLSRSNLQLVARELMLIWEPAYQDALAARLERAKEGLRSGGTLGAQWVGS